MKSGPRKCRPLETEITELSRLFYALAILDSHPDSPSGRAAGWALFPDGFDAEVLRAWWGDFDVVATTQACDEARVRVKRASSRELNDIAQRGRLQLWRLQHFLANRPTVLL